eukprot:5165885-Prymnesium_polylepis.2
MQYTLRLQDSVSATVSTVLKAPPSNISRSGSNSSEIENPSEIAATIGNADVATATSIAAAAASLPYSAADAAVRPGVDENISCPSLSRSPARELTALEARPRPRWRRQANLSSRRLRTRIRPSSVWTPHALQLLSELSGEQEARPALGDPLDHGRRRVPASTAGALAAQGTDRCRHSDCGAMSVSATAGFDNTGLLPEWLLARDRG